MAWQVEEFLDHSGIEPDLCYMQIILLLRFNELTVSYVGRSQDNSLPLRRLSYASRPYFMWVYFLMTTIVMKDLSIDSKLLFSLLLTTRYK